MAPSPPQPDTYWPGADPAAQALAAQVAGALRAGIWRRGIGTLVVCGGRTPVPFLRALALAPLRWSQVLVTQSDERWVPPGAAGSNARLLRRHLLRARARSATLLALRGQASSVHQGRRQAAAVLRALPRPWDAVVLGMGEDGHFASLFPGDGKAVAEQLAVDGPRAVVVTRAPARPHVRLSLTLASLLDTRHLWLLVEGRAKAEVYARAWGAPAGCAAREFPVTALLRQRRTAVQVWRIGAP